MSRRRAPRLGFRGELLLLPPAALLLLLAVSAFTLFSYRNALGLFAEERRAEAARLAGAAAAALGAAAAPTPEALHRLAPRAERVLLLDAQGRLIAAWGEPPEDGAGDPLAPLGAARALAGPVGIGPGRGLPAGVIAGFAPLGPPAERRVLRLDLDAGPLAAQLAGLRILLPVALAAGAAVVVLMLLFLRYLVTPFDALLERARQLGGAGAAAAGGGGPTAAVAAAAGAGGAEGGDEIAFLVRTFERAVEALAARAANSAVADEADIAALSRTLVRSLESGVLLLDAAGAVLALNDVGAGLLGMETPAAGAPASQLLAAHPDLARAVDAAVTGREGVQRREIEVASPGAGGARTLGLTVHPLRRDDGAVRGFLVLFADLTESVRRAEEARLADSLAGLGELAAGVAHELRNSLATLRGYLTLIDRSPRGAETVADYLGEIRRETDHLQRVLEDFLAFARPGTARLEPVDLLAVARRAASDPALSGAFVEVEDRCPASVRVHGDPQLLERAVRNLLHNSVQAIEGKTGAEPVVVGVERTAAGLVLTVDDRGCGVPEEIRERLFQPFATARPGGVGLGLALTRRIVTLHGGGLRLEDRPGGGTRATIAFPPDVLVTIGNSSADSPSR